MATPIARIADLNLFPGNPSGGEIAEISTGGTGSFQITLAQLPVRVPQTISAGGTFTVTNITYGDILVTTTAAVTVQLPAASVRNGVPLSVVALQSSTPNITIRPSGVETIVGLSSVTITVPYGAVNLWPVATGSWYTK
jgi:hypothetical protein